MARPAALRVPAQSAYGLLSRMTLLRSSVAVCAGMFLLSLLAYGWNLGSWFQEDDYGLLWKVASKGPLGLWTFEGESYFRPFISFTLWLQYKVSGLNPWPYHLLNVVAHAGVGFGLFLVLKRVLGAWPHARAAAFWGALLFVVHPSRPESVDWISGRTDVFAACLGIFSIYCFIRYIQSSRSLPWLAGSLGLFLVGMLCKEAVLVVPLVCLAYLLIFERSGRRRVLVQAGSLFAVAIALYVVTRLMLLGPQIQGELTRSGGGKLVATTLVQLVRCMLPGLPIGDPLTNNSLVIRTPAALAYLGLGLAIFALLVYLARRFPASVPEKQARLFLLTGFVLGLLPVAGLGVRLFRSQGERFLYWPSLFLLPLAALILYSALRNRPYRQFVMGSLALLCFGLLQVENSYWRQGADISQRLHSSLIGDVLPAAPAQGPIVLLNVPCRVQGAYTVKSDLKWAAMLNGFDDGSRLKLMAVYGLYGSRDAVSALISPTDVRFSMPPGMGAFSEEETFGDAGATPEQRLKRGFVEFSPREVLIDRRALGKGPAFVWNGTRFVAIGPMAQSSTREK